MKDHYNSEDANWSPGFSGTKVSGRDADFAAADAASWPMHDRRCLVCSRSGPGPFGATICDRCEAQLISIFGREADGELSARAYDWIFDRAGAHREAGVAP